MGETTDSLTETHPFHIVQFAQYTGRFSPPSVSARLNDGIIISPIQADGEDAGLHSWYE